MPKWIQNERYGKTLTRQSGKKSRVRNYFTKIKSDVQARYMSSILVSVMYTPFYLLSIYKPNSIYRSNTPWIKLRRGLSTFFWFYYHFVLVQLQFFTRQLLGWQANPPPVVNHQWIIGYYQLDWSQLVLLNRFRITGNLFFIANMTKGIMILMECKIYHIQHIIISL